jgi:hypothetical protein
MDGGPGCDPCQRAARLQVLDLGLQQFVGHGQVPDLGFEAADLGVAAIRQFCASASARLQACADFDAKREFLVGPIERVIYNRYKVTIVGSIPVQSTSGDTKLLFRIEGEIDKKAIRSRPREIRADDGRRRSLEAGADGFTSSHAPSGQLEPSELAYRLEPLQSPASRGGNWGISVNPPAVTR